MKKQSLSTLPRRVFLKTSATAAAAASLSSLDIARSAYAAGSDVLGVRWLARNGADTTLALVRATAKVKAVSPLRSATALCKTLRRVPATLYCE